MKCFVAIFFLLASVAVASAQQCDCGELEKTRSDIEKIVRSGSISTPLYKIEELTHVREISR